MNEQHDHDDVWLAITELRNQVDYLTSELRRVSDAARDAGYRADDAKRAADDAQRSSQRGW